MKKHMLPGYCIGIFLGFLINCPAPAQQKDGGQNVSYRLDVKKSKILWKAPKSRGNQHNGYLLFNSGTLSDFKGGRPTRGYFSMNMHTISSTDRPSAEGRKKVDDELKSETFFAVSRFPNANMQVKQIVPEDNGTNYRVHGDLTIRGITKPVEFNAIIKMTGNMISASANMTINRVKWNIGNQPNASSWNLMAQLKNNLIDDEIPVTLYLVFNKN